MTRSDRKRVFEALRQWCSSGTIVALRSRALITLAADSGLRVRECVRLDLDQLLSDPDARAVRLRESFYLLASQAKGGERGAGMVDVSERAREALRAYILAIRDAEWIDWPVEPGTPLFLGHRGHRGKPGHGRMSVRTAQHSWHDVQKRARLTTRYEFHCLRHDGASRLRQAGADVFDLMKQMRWRDVNHAQLYIHEIDSQARGPELQKRASKL